MGIVLLVIVTIAVILNGTIAATQQADRHLSAMRTAAQRGQKVALEVSGLASTSRKLFSGDDVGQGYLGALALGTLTRDNTARLPVVAEDAVMDDDDADLPLTGNILLFIRESDPAPCVADALNGKIRSIDTFRLICVYPHMTTQSLAANRGAARDLVIWRSVAYPSWSQINDIADATQKKNVLKDLYVRFGYRQAWDPEAAVTAAFYRFDATGTLNGTPEAAFSIPEDRTVSDRGRLVYARAELATTADDEFSTRRVLSDDSTATAWKPNGFEVKVTGTLHTRKLWIHLVVEVAEQGGARTAVLPATVIATCQDM